MRIQLSLFLAMASVFGSGGVAAAQPVCGAAADQPAGTPPGYQVRRIVVDPVLGHRWAWIEDCSHPERPAQIVALPPPPGAGLRKNIGAASAAPPAAISGGGPALAAGKTTAAFAGAVFNRVSSNLSRPQSSIPGFALSSPTALVSPPVSPSAGSSAEPLIRAGDRVHLWSSAANMRLEIDVIALEYGRAGQVIHLRRNGQQTLLAGVVVSKDSAELMP